MHAAKVKSSPRLQRLLEVLSDGRQHSSLDLCMNAYVVALSAAISELRANGAVIEVERYERDGGPVWLYRLVQPPSGAAA